MSPAHSRSMFMGDLRLGGGWVWGPPMMGGVPEGGQGWVTKGPILRSVDGEDVGAVAGDEEWGGCTGDICIMLWGEGRRP